MSSEGNVQYLHHDQSGSTQLLTGESDEVLGSYSYSPYGEVTGHTGTATSPLGYDSEYTNSDTGLQYLRARTYDPSTGQFMTVDPLAYETNARYEFADDNPVGYRDRSGLQEESASGGIGLPCVWPCAPPPTVREGPVEHVWHTVAFLRSWTTRADQGPRLAL